MGCLMGCLMGYLMIMLMGIVNEDFDGDFKRELYGIPMGFTVRRSQGVED